MTTILKTTALIATWTALMLWLPLAAGAQEAAGRWNTNADNVMLDGYDVVAYFTTDRPTRGRADLSARHDGATFYFSSRSNLDAFRKEPKKYAPKFGGFCAFGVAANQAKVPVDPSTYKIHNGELLLFFNDMYQGQKVNTKILWNQNEPELYVQAVQTWKTLG